ncbi:MAG: hypothetical protein RLZZ584_2488 [Pseudomonadota bacterium]|jgi:hypothetical protein
MRPPKKPAGKTTGGAAALHVDVSGTVAQVVIGNVMQMATSQRDDLAEIEAHAARACADIQALSRAAGLLMLASPGRGANFHQAAALILESMLPAVVHELQGRIAGQGLQQPAPACRTVPRAQARRAA